MDLWTGLGKLIRILSPENEHHNKLRRQKCIETCLQKNRRLGKDKTSSSSSSLDQLHVLIYEKRLAGDYEEADQLLAQCQRLRDLPEGSPDLGPVLQLLVLLHNPKKAAKDPLEESQSYFPFRSALPQSQASNQAAAAVAAAEPKTTPKFGGLDHLEVNARTYPHFDAKVFSFPEDRTPSKKSFSSIFELDPGSGLALLGGPPSKAVTSPPPLMAIPPMELTLDGLGRPLRIPWTKNTPASSPIRKVNRDDEGYSSPEPKSGKAFLAIPIPRKKCT